MIQSKCVLDYNSHVVIKGLYWNFFLHVYILSRMNPWISVLNGYPRIREPTRHTSENLAARSRYLRPGWVIASCSLLWDVITYPCLRYLLLPTKSTCHGKRDLHQMTLNICIHQLLTGTPWGQKRPCKIFLPRQSVFGSSIIEEFYLIKTLFSQTSQ